MKIDSSATQSVSGRIDWVDLAKGICIILVVMMHTTLGIERATGEAGWMLPAVEFARPFRMPDFFMISGLFLAATINRPWRLYLDRKVVHFFYFYFLWVIIQFAFKGPFMMAEGHSIDTVLSSLLFSVVQPFGTLWFIYMLPVFFVVTKLFNKVPWALFGAAVVLQLLPVDTTSILEAMVATTGAISADRHWVLIDEFCSFYVYFLAGYLFAPWIFRIADAARAMPRAGIAVVAAWFCFNLIMVLTGWSTLPVLSLFLGGFGAVAIVIFASLLSLVPFTGWLRHIGANSIVVYLAFFLPMVVMRLLLLKFAPGLDAGTMALVSIMVAVVSPLIVHAIILRLGFGRFLFYRPKWAMFSDMPKRPKASLQAAE